MTEIRGGGEQQGTNLVEGALRTVDRMGRTLSRHLERVARDNERLRNERDTERAERAQRNTDQRPVTNGGSRAGAYLGGANDPEVDRVSRSARGTPVPVGPRGVEVPLDGRGPVMPAASINAARDAARVAPNGQGAAVTRGYGSGPMLRVDYGQGPVRIEHPDEREIIREVVENNPRAFPSFAAWVNAVMGLRGESVDALTAERVAMAAREYRGGGDPRIGGLEPPDAAPTPEELREAESELMAIVRANRATGGRSAILDRSRSLAATDPLVALPSILQGPVRRALVQYDSWRAEGDRMPRLRSTERENHDMRETIRGTKSDRNGAKQQGSSAAGAEGVSFEDRGELPGVVTPGLQPETNSRTLAITRPPDGQSRMDRLEGRIANGPLAPLVGVAAVAGGEEVPLGETGLSVDREGRVRGAWRW